MSKRKKIRKCKAHLTITVGEVREGDYSLCDQCGGKTMLIIAPSEWSVDSEPYKADEKIDRPDYVHVGDEITAHYCNDCSRITSLSFNEL